MPVEHARYGFRTLGEAEGHLKMFKNPEKYEIWALNDVTDPEWEPLGYFIMERVNGQAV